MTTKKRTRDGRKCEADCSTSPFHAWLDFYFRQLRFAPKHHLGLGDIRLTIAMQDKIVSSAKLAMSNAEAQTRRVAT